VGHPAARSLIRQVVSFKRKHSGVRLTLDPIEVAVLAQVIGEVVDVIGPPPVRNEGAQWARELGLAGLGEFGGSGDAGGAAEDAPAPIDPVTARLFPDAYRDDDEAARDFRRFTGEELRAKKSANAQLLLGSLPEGGGSITLDDDASSAWLGALNDARLALGTALDVNENTHEELSTLEAGEPRAQRLLVYLWLGELLESLLYAIGGE
jgi:hypothetical protein